MFTHMNTWMIGKNSMKHHYLKKGNFIITFINNNNNNNNNMHREITAFLQHV